MILRSTVDTHAREATPATNYGGGARLWLNGGGGSNDRQAFIYFSRQFPLGATLLSATLRVRLYGSWAGTNNVTVSRIIEKWSESGLTWNNRPDVTTANQATAVVTGGADKAVVEFDVKNMLQAVADGGAFFGFRLTLTENVDRALRSGEDPSVLLRPSLELEWSEAPQPPDRLAPDGGDAVHDNKPLLRWRFDAKPVNPVQTSSQVQISTSTDFSSPEYDSGKVANAEQQWDLAATAYGGVADGVTRYWRVRVWDGVDLVSAWSAAAEFKRDTLGTLAILEPGTAVGQTTPPIIWQLSGATQESYRVQVWEVPTLSSDLNDSSGARLIWSARGAGTTNQVTVPAGKIKSGKLYRTRVEVWDTIDRAADEHLTAESTFVYSRGVAYDYGIASGGTLGSPGMTVSRVEQELDDYLLLGARHIRADVPWSATEPTLGARDWTWADKWIPRAHARGLKIIVTFSYSPTWVTGAGADNKVAPTTAGEIAAYAQAAADLVARYPYIHAIEIWNEPNLGNNFWKPSADPAKYAELLIAAYTAIKAVAPNMIVVMGGLAGAADYRGGPGVTFGHVVGSGGAIYQTTIANNPNAPPGTGWTNLTPYVGSWVSGASYTNGDYVLHAATNTIWRCILTHSGIALTPPNDSTRWTFVADYRGAFNANQFRDRAPADFLGHVIAAGASGSFDAVGIHPYINKSAPVAGDIDFEWEGWTYFGYGSWLGNDSNSIRSRLTAAGLSGKQLWMTEAGNVNLTGQSASIPLIFSKWETYSDAGPLSWYTWRDIDSYSLVDASLNHRAGWTTMQTELALRAGAAAPATLTVEPQSGSPEVVLTWTRSPAPDYFSLRVDGVEVEDRIVPGDVILSSGTYRMSYWRADPRVVHTYEIEAVTQDGANDPFQHSTNNPTRTAATSHIGVWLVDEDDGTAVRILGREEADMRIGEQATTYYPIGGVPVRIRDSVRGYEGSFAGVLDDAADKDAFLELKGRNKELLLVVGDMTIPVRLEDATCTPRSGPTHTWSVGFAFFQTDEPWPVARSLDA